MLNHLDKRITSRVSKRLEGNPAHSSLIRVGQAQLRRRRAVGWAGTTAKPASAQKITCNGARRDEGNHAKLPALRNLREG